MIKTRQYPKTVFKLCDENGNQLYSPYDKDGNKIKTACKVYMNQDNYIPLPANYDGDTYTDFDAGIYFWHLEPENALPNFDPIFIPITVHISNEQTYPEYIFDTSNNNVIKDYANIYTLSELSGYFYGNISIVNVKLILPNAIDCDTMFYGCSALTDVGLNIPNLSDYSNMFSGASNLEVIDVTIPSNLVNDFKEYVLNLNLLKLRRFIINNELIYSQYIIDALNNDILEECLDIYTLTDISNYFSNPEPDSKLNRNIKSINLILPNITTCSHPFGMFGGRSDLVSIDLNVRNIVNGFSGAFQNCSSLVTANIDASSAKYCNHLFRNCSNVKDIKLNLSSIEEFPTDMLSGAPNIETIDITVPANFVNDFRSYINSLNLEHLTSLVINGDQYIDDCILIQNNNVIEDYANIYTLSDLYRYFYANRDISKVNLALPNATRCNSLFLECSALTDATLSLSNATNCGDMFRNCSALTSVDLSLPSAFSCGGMFMGCSALISVDLNLPSAPSCPTMFGNCSALTDVKLNIPNLVSYGNMFSGASNLETIDVTIPSNLVNDFKSYVLGLNLEHLTSLVINEHQYNVYYDSASVDNSARYVPCVVEGGTPKTIQFNTDKYYFPNPSGNNTAFVSSVNVSNNCIIEADLYRLENSDYGLGIGFSKVTASGKANYNGLSIFNGSVSWYGYSNQSWNTSNYWNRNMSENVTNKWIHIKIVRNENDVTITFTNDTNNVILDTTGTVASFVQGENCYLAFFSSQTTGYIKNIKVAEL